MIPIIEIGAEFPEARDMAAESNTIEQAVSRTLRDNLEKIQRTADELHQAIHDLVSACASSRPSNTLPPMIRVQTSAASLAASMDVLSRFVTGALHHQAHSPLEMETLSAPSQKNVALPPARLEQPPPEPVHPIKVKDHSLDETPWTMPQVAEKAPAQERLAASDMIAAQEIPPAMDLPPVAEIAPSLDQAFLSESLPAFAEEPTLEPEGIAEFVEEPAIAPTEAEPIFSLDALPPDEQELHRRAYRVAKVSMQDIKMLRPEDVRAGRENKDICVRLRDDIEKAHKEYDRRFQSIQSHPVDYFYDWLVEILGGGDPQALGPYPYSSAVLHR
jgi:uncharacterized damage-inducible protein DinB